MMPCQTKLAAFNPPMPRPKKPPLLEMLLKAKEESDRRNYPAKHEILRRIIAGNPDEFAVDSEKNNILGVTHSPTAFRIHMPKSQWPLARTGAV